MIAFLWTILENEVGTYEKEEKKEDDEEDEYEKDFGRFYNFDISYLEKPIDYNNNNDTKSFENDNTHKIMTTGSSNNDNCISVFDKDATITIHHHHFDTFKN